MDEQFQNLPIFGVNFCILNWKNSIHFLFFQTVTCRKFFWIFGILEFCLFGNFRNLPKFYDFEIHQIFIVDKLIK